MVVAYYKETRNRRTKTVIQTCNAEELGYCSEAGPWVTVCMDHSSIVNHSRLSDARGWSSSPEAWCEDCQEITNNQEGYT